MNALVVGNFMSGAGHRQYCEELSDRLESRAWAVTRTSRRLPRLERLADMLGTAWRARRRYDVALVDVYSGPAFLWAEAVCFELERLGKPFVLTLHGGNLPNFAKRWRWRVRHLLRSANAVVAPSPYLRRAMAAHRADIEIIPNAIDTVKYRPGARARPARLIWLRTFHRTYNPVLAVEVLARVRRSYPEIRLEMVGADKRDGSLEEVQRRIAELGLESGIDIILGVPKGEVPGRLRHGDIFLNTSEIDNTPVTVIEAMASGLPIVTTRVGGIPDLVQDGHDGLVTPRNDAGAMAAAVVALITDDALRDQLSRNAEARARDFDWNAVLTSWENLAHRVLAR